ncbi:MAG: hypothetical protein RL466_247, partial [Actinomycetota bacterium]
LAAVEVWGQRSDELGLIHSIPLNVVVSTRKSLSACLTA